MIELYDEMPLNGRLTYFEAYVFATADKHIMRHQSFNDVSAAILNGNKVVISIDDPDSADVTLRKNVLTAFNRTLASKGFDYNNIRKGQVQSQLIYFGMPDEDGISHHSWQDECKVTLEALKQFAKSEDRIVGYMVHANQMLKDSAAFSYPHVHVIYESKREYELEDWLAARL